MAWDRPPVLHAFGKPLVAFDLYEAGTECHAVPVSLIPIILGALDELRSPDAWTGDNHQRAIALQQIGNFIGLFGTKFTLCECPDNGEIDQPQYPIGFEALESEECCMSGCSIPYGALRWNNGVLEYLYCGVWYPVEGDTTEETVIIPPEIDTDETTIYPCGKAQALAEFIVKLGDESWDESDNVLPLFFIQHMQGIMGADLKNGWLQQIQNLALIMKGLIVVPPGAISINKSDVVLTDMVDSVACKLLPAMSATATDDKDAIYSAAKNAMKLLFPPGSLPYGLWTSPYWDYVLNAIGPTLMAEIAQSGAYTNAECNCEGGVVSGAYTGSIVWDGTWETQFATPGGNIALGEVWVDDDAKTMFLLISAADGAASQEMRIRLFVDGAVAGDKIKIRQYPVDSKVELMTENWSSGAPVYASSLWREPTNNLNHTNVTEVYVDGAGFITYEITANTNVSALTDFVVGGKYNPQGGVTPHNTYIFAVEITGVNGVEYPTRHYTTRTGQTQLLP